MRYWLHAVLLIVVATAGPLHAGAQEKPPTPAAPTPAVAPDPKKANERPAAQANEPAEPFALATVAQMAEQCVRLETAAGLIEFELLPESAPETVRHFLQLTAAGALDTTTFSRVVPGFVVQGGNLATRQTQTPDTIARARRTILDEPNNVPHVRGIVSMARPDVPNGATTHFFILVGDAAHLNGTFAAFGRVTKGMETVDTINRAEVVGDKPQQPVRLTRATLFTCARPAPAQTEIVPPEE